MVKSSVIILAIIICAAFAAPPAPAPERIVGGSPTVIQEYPYIVSLQRLWFGTMWSHSCGGSLVTYRSILTAAHCFYDSNQASLWQARVGSSFRSYGGQMIAASRLIMHEEYDDDIYINDIAIMVLSRSAVLSDAVQVVYIAPSVYPIPDNSVVTALGWGTLTEQGTSPEQLQHVNINVINQQVCEERYKYLASTNAFFPFKINDGMMCSGILDVGGKDACQGDSGGPVSLKTAHGYVVVGVTSWGYGCAHPVYPGVNAKVSYYTNWIIQNGSV